MVIVNDSGTNAASILTRPATADYFAMVITEKATNIPQVVWPSVVVDEYGYALLDFSFDFEDGKNYFAHLYATEQNGSGTTPINPALVEKEVWRGRIFCTTQTDLQVFTMYTDQYNFVATKPTFTYM